MFYFMPFVKKPNQHAPIRLPWVSSPLQVSFSTLNPSTSSYCPALALLCCQALPYRTLFFLQVTETVVLFTSAEVFGQCTLFGNYLLLFRALHKPEAFLHVPWSISSDLLPWHVKSPFMYYCFPSLLLFFKNKNNYYFFCDCLWDGSFPLISI